MPSKKPSHIPISDQSDYTSVSPPVAISVHPSPFPGITPTTFPSYVPSEKPMVFNM